jgi:hypothetical protein
VQGFEIPVGDVIGLIRWFPLEGEWRHELITGQMLDVDGQGRIVLGADVEDSTAYDADVWSVCATVPEPLRGFAS